MLETTRRRILLCATGTSPQIVTETLYALAVQPDEPWIPDEIHLISTSIGADKARLKLLSDTPGWFHKLCQDYKLPAIHFDPSTIHCIQNEEGEDLDDIRTLADNEAAANSIAELVRKLTEDDHSELHVSLAGGRKTMGYYLGFALSLYGRPQDRLSHILVKEDFLGLLDFYYPTPYSHFIQPHDSNALKLDCADAIVEIAKIPFVRMRDGLPNRLLSGKANFTETVEIANLSHGEAHLHIDTSTRSIKVNGISATLTDTQFALLYWFAKRALSGNPEIHWHKYEEFIGEYIPNLARIFERSPSIVISMEETYKGWEAMCKHEPNQRKVQIFLENKLKHYFEPKLSKMQRSLIDELSAPLAARCKIDKYGTNTGYSLPEGLQITIV